MSDSILLGNYSPEAVNLVIAVGGQVHNVAGFIDGTFITSARMVPSSTPYIGSDLSGGRSKRRNRSRTLGFTLHQYAASNAFLQAWQDADEADDGSKYVASVTMKDSSGTTLISSSQAILTTTADISFGTDQEPRAWELFMFNCAGGVGTNTLMGAAEVAAIEGLGGNVPAAWRS